MYHSFSSVLTDIHSSKFEHNRDHKTRTNRKYLLGTDEDREKKKKEKEKNDRVHASEVSLMKIFGSIF